MARLDEHAETIKAALPPLSGKPSEYVCSGRYFQSIEIPEGVQLTKAVADLVGDEVLMYASIIRTAKATFLQFRRHRDGLGNVGESEAQIALG